MKTYNEQYFKTKNWLMILSERKKLRLRVIQIPSKLLNLMMDPKVPPQNRAFDFLEEINREELEIVSGYKKVYIIKLYFK